MNLLPYESYHPLKYLAKHLKMILSKKERRVYDLLYNLEGDTAWHAAIHVNTRLHNEPSFRELIEQLKSQAKDDFQTMKNILGSKVFKAVINL